MIITFSPMRRDQTLSLDRAGDVLIINGQAFDFSDLAEGASLSPETIASDWIAGDVTRQGGVLNVPVILPHGAHASQDVLFPAPLALAGDGPVALPA